jgi:hypothetical protein
MGKTINHIGLLMVLALLVIALGSAHWFQRVYLTESYDNSPVVTCTADSTWTGVWSGHAAPVGLSLIQECKTGGVAAATCMQDGKWIFTDTCAELASGHAKAPAPPPPPKIESCTAPDGKIAPVGATITNKCPDGGSQAGTCQADGTWILGPCHS